jgi:hypothetical protein
VIVEHYPARAKVPEGYELEVFAANGQTITVVSVSTSAIREATEREVLSVREMTRHESSSAASFRTVPQLSLFSVRIGPT